MTPLMLAPRSPARTLRSPSAQIWAVLACELHGVKTSGQLLAGMAGMAGDAGDAVEQVPGRAEEPRC